MAVIVCYDDGKGNIDLDPPRYPVDINNHDVDVSEDGTITVTIGIDKHECDEGYYD